METGTRSAISLKEQAMKKTGHYNGYRTVSFFGFNAPDRLPQVKHFHTIQQGSAPSKYIPLRRSKSLDDLFATEKVLNNDDEAFAKIAKVRKILQSESA